MLKGNIYPGFSKKPYLTELVANGQHLLHGIQADAGWFEGIAVQESLLQLAVRGVEALQYFRFQSVWYNLVYRFYYGDLILFYKIQYPSQLLNFSSNSMLNIPSFDVKIDWNQEDELLVLLLPTEKQNKNKIK